MKIERADLLEQLSRFALAGHGVVIGRPGVGKTHSVRELHREFSVARVPHLLLPIDKLGGGTEDDLRAAFSYDGDFLEAVARQFESRDAGTGVLIFDGFDAARNEEARQRFLSLIRRAVRESKDLWRVLVTVRAYDASRSQALLQLFGSREESPPVRYRDVSVRCRHFVVPLLAAAEIEDAVRQIPGLEELRAHGARDFGELLKVPFNLWLLEQILAQPGDTAAVSAIQSETQLLGLYWRLRVLAHENADLREYVLNAAARGMVETRSLTIRKDAIYSPRVQSAWEDLRSAEVLVEVRPLNQRVAFSHNIIFDYAVSVLLIDDDAESLLEFIRADLSRPLFLRPSLVYYFTRLWHEARDTFWRVVWRLLTAAEVHVRLVARVIPPLVVLSESRAVPDFAPLLAGLAKGQHEAREFVLRLFQARRMTGRVNPMHWGDFCVAASEHLDRHFAWDLTTTASELLDSENIEDRASLEARCGGVGRAVLQWVWRKRGTGTDRWLDALGANWAVPLVAKTFASDPELSARLLREVLGLIDEPDFPIQYFYTLADQVPILAAHDPKMVGDLYRTVFRHREESQAETHFGSPVLPLRSNRRQDFGMCEYVLSKHYSAFLAVTPREAAEAAVDCVNAYVVADRVAPYVRGDQSIETMVEEFTFRGRSAHYLPDSSFIWDSYAGRESPVQLATVLFRKVAESAKADPTQLSTLLDVLADRAIAAYFWRELLIVGAEAPETFAGELFELCVARPVQWGSDTLHELGQFIEASSPFLTDSQREQLERSIVSLPEAGGAPKKRESLERIRDRLVARIPGEKLVTADARQLRQHFERGGAVPSNEPLATFSTESKTFTEDDWLAEQGVEVDAPSNQSLRAHFSALEQFDSTWRNKIPTEEAVIEFLPTLSAARAAAEEFDDADKRVLTAAWTKLASCAETMSRLGAKLPRGSFDTARELLLRAAVHAEPAPNQAADFSFPAWSPAPRIEAAQGLAWLCTSKFADPSVVEAFKKLVHDPVPAVRFLAAAELFRLRRAWPETFWAMTNDIVHEETNLTVLGGFCAALSRLPPEDDEQIGSLLAALLQRGVDLGERSDFRDTFVRLVVWLGLNRHTDWGKRTLTQWSSDPIRFTKLLHQAVFEALTAITVQHLADPKVRPVSQRALEWLMAVLSAVRRSSREVRAAARDAWTEEQRGRLTELYEIVDEIVRRLYYNAKLPNEAAISDSESGVLTEELRGYFETVRPLLEQVVEFSLDRDAGTMLAPTAHHFMELLRGVVEFDPAGVLHLAAGVARASEGANYNLDSMAVREVVGLTEAILADHREVVRDGQGLEDLVALLDVFARAGWPEALRLVWRLDEVFR